MKSDSNENKRKSSKIVIEKQTDLLKITKSQIDASKLSDYSGKLYEEIYREALEIERAQSQLEKNSPKESEAIPISKLTFQMVYETVFGEELGLLGSTPCLGEWKEKNIIFFSWTPGNIWTKTFEMKTKYFSKEYEFKFVVTRNRVIKRWQNGDNLKFQIGKYYNEAVRKSHKGVYKNTEYQYFEKERELRIKFFWK